MNRAPIASILVAGDGIVGRSAALAFSRGLPQVEVSLLALQSDPAALADAGCATLPTVGRFHAAIGVDELDLVQRGIACHHLGTHVTGGAHDWIRSFGDVGRGEGAVPFRQMWFAARQGDAALAFDRYSPASVMGAAGKFVHPSRDPASPLANHVYGLRFDPARTRDLLGQAIRHLTTHDGDIATIDRRADGGIAALVLANGNRLAADLFIDCSGPAARLIGSVSDNFDDWSHWLPARHVAQAWTATDTIAPLDELTAREGGWQVAASVPGGRLDTIVTSDPTPGSVAIRPGRRREPFVANVLALGDAAIALDPLHGANLSLAHNAILRAIALLPGRDCHLLELGEYNRLTTLEAERARDYHILFHSHLAPTATPPPTLARTLAQWRARGRLSFFEEEMFTESDWEQALLGLGLLPDAVAPVARAIDPVAAAKAMAGFAGELESLAARLPPYADYLARMRSDPRARG